MSSRSRLAGLVTLVAALGCSGQSSDRAAGAASNPPLVGAGGSADGSAGTPTGGNGAGSAGASSLAGSGGVAGSAAQGGSADAAGSGGQAGTSARQLERVLAYDYVDINPTTGALRGHTGGGADERLLEALATEHGFELVITADAADFTSEYLSQFDVVVFASPDYVGQALSTGQRDALEAFVRQGGGWVGWHYALWVEKGWPFISVLGGGVAAKGHVGGLQPMKFTVVNASHPIMQGVPPNFDVKDDFLAMTGDPGQDPAVSVLVRAALTAAPGGNDHPVIWAHEVGEGRAYYSMLGHFAAGFATPEAKTLMWNALRWVAPTLR